LAVLQLPLLATEKAKGLNSRTPATQGTMDARGGELWIHESMDLRIYGEAQRAESRNKAA